MINFHLMKDFALVVHGGRLPQGSSLLATHGSLIAHPDLPSDSVAAKN
jgi:hypothetical protein